ALAKARHAAHHSGLPALADDAGLCVDAFGGLPGVQTADYACQFGYAKGDDNNVLALLAQMQHIEQRGAALVSTLVALRSAQDPEPLIAVGRAVGEISRAPCGDKGFGFDPVMFIPRFGKTFAELPEATKNAHSHRGQAARAMRPGTLQLAALPPLSLYVHLPWCIHKCPYCDFNSHEMRTADLPEQRYLDALMADLEAALPLVWGRTVHSVFIGGGTPSLFSPAAIDQMLGGIRARLRLEADCEITLEANPGSFETDRFRAFRAAGVTRLSLGVQSFHDGFLTALGRVHNRAQALAAAQEAAQTFETFNLDIMYGLPGQTLADLSADLSTALSLSPPHISVYHLTVEPNTRFAKYPPVL
ncbi:MAG: radical SAM family heme chaperone HemW, partial [Betaproteobacteria bacterium]|nr:radical SAM family heme chaperone HemW [Betaproteobacteria bacterium]